MNEVNAWIKKANNELESCKFLFDNGFVDFIGLIYLVMFSSVKALLLKKQINSKTHEGLIYLFLKEYVKTELFPKSSFKDFCLCKEIKTKYFNDFSFKLTPELISEYIDKSEIFLKEAEKLI